jgi:hypothetical protein
VLNATIIFSHKIPVLFSFQMKIRTEYDFSSDHGTCICVYDSCFRLLRLALSVNPSRGSCLELDSNLKLQCSSDLSSHEILDQR